MPHLVKIYLFNRGNRYENTNVRIGWNHELFTLMKWVDLARGLENENAVCPKILFTKFVFNFPRKHNFI